MRLLNFKNFNEAISGTELVGKHMGPNYPEQDNTNTTIGTKHTELIYCEIDSKIYSYDEYQDVYQEYLKISGKPLQGFTKDNLNTVLLYLNNNS